MAFQIQASFDRASTRKDGCLGLSFSTQELSVADKVTVMDFCGAHGWLLFAPNEHDLGDVPKEPAADGKSPSQRLRAAIYVLWEQRGRKGEFDTFYRRSMERAITRVKDLLNE